MSVHCKFEIWNARFSFQLGSGCWGYGNWMLILRCRLIFDFLFFSVFLFFVNKSNIYSDLGKLVFPTPKSFVSGWLYLCVRRFVATFPLSSAYIDIGISWGRRKGVGEGGSAVAASYKLSFLLLWLSPCAFLASFLLFFSAPPRISFE